MKTQIRTAATLAAATFALFAGAAAAQSDRATQQLSAVTAAAPATLEWACANPGAPSFAATEHTGLGRGSVYQRRLALATLIRQTCHAHGDQAVLVFMPRDGGLPLDLVAIR